MGVGDDSVESCCRRGQWDSLYSHMKGVIRILRPTLSAPVPAWVHLSASKAQDREALPVNSNTVRDRCAESIRHRYHRHINAGGLHVSTPFWRFFCFLVFGPSRRARQPARNASIGIDTCQWFRLRSPDNLAMPRLDLPEEPARCAAIQGTVIRLQWGCITTRRQRTAANLTGVGVIPSVSEDDRWKSSDSAPPTCYDLSDAVVLECDASLIRRQGEPSPCSSRTCGISGKQGMQRRGRDSNPR